MPDSLFYWIGVMYREEAYMAGLKIGGILCSFADIFVAAAFLAVMDSLRGRPPSKRRYCLLAVFALLTPSLLLPGEGIEFFIAQFAVLAPPYLVLIYTAVTEARYFVARVKEGVSGGTRTRR
jgi:hypothetical protein